MAFRSNQLEQWNLRFQEMVDFKKENNHCLVPLQYQKNPSLAHWVKRQRHQYRMKKEGKHSTMTDEREAVLEQLGFVWDSHAAVWEERLCELRKFRDHHGHCRVPKQYPPNQALAVWVKGQRRQFKLRCEGKDSNMTSRRITKLTEIDFDFSPRSKKPSTSLAAISHSVAKKRSGNKIDNGTAQQSTTSSISSEEYDDDGSFLAQGHSEAKVSAEELMIPSSTSLERRNHSQQDEDLSNKSSLSELSQATFVPPATASVMASAVENPSISNASLLREFLRLNPPNSSSTGAVAADHPHNTHHQGQVMIPNLPSLLDSSAATLAAAAIMAGSATAAAAEANRASQLGSVLEGLSSILQNGTVAAAGAANRRHDSDNTNRIIQSLNGILPLISSSQNNAASPSLTPALTPPSTPAVSPLLATLLRSITTPNDTASLGGVVSSLSASAAANPPATSSYHTNHQQGRLSTTGATDIASLLASIQRTALPPPPPPPSSNINDISAFLAAAVTTNPPPQQQEPTQQLLGHLPHEIILALALKSVPK